MDTVNVQWMVDRRVADLVRDTARTEQVPVDAWVADAVEAWLGRTRDTKPYPLATVARPAGAALRQWHGDRLVPMLWATWTVQAGWSVDEVAGLLGVTVAVVRDWMVEAAAVLMSRPPHLGSLLATMPPVPESPAGMASPGPRPAMLPMRPGDRLCDRLASVTEDGWVRSPVAAVEQALWDRLYLDGVCGRTPLVSNRVEESMLPGMTG